MHKLFDEGFDVVVIDEMSQALEAVSIDLLGFLDFRSESQEIEIGCNFLLRYFPPLMIITR